MWKLLPQTLLLIAMLLCPPIKAFADTVYIRDVLYVPLRGGESNEHRILQLVKSGTKLEQLSSDETSGFSKVKTLSGMEGYLQTQYLVTEPIARDLLDEYQEKVTTTEAAQQRTQLRVSELEESLAKMTMENATLIEQNKTLMEELESITSLAANVIQIDERNELLELENQQLQTETDLIIAQNRALENNQDQQWFLRGGGTVLLGLLFGFWVSRRIYHHKRSDGWG